MRPNWQPIHGRDPRHNQEARTPTGRLVVRLHRPNAPAYFARVNSTVIGWSYRSMDEAKQAAEQANAKLAVYAGIPA